MSAVIAYLLIVGALLAIAARAGEELLRIAGRPTRWAWAAALVLVAVLTIGTLVAGPTPTERSVDLPRNVVTSTTAVHGASPLWHRLGNAIAQARTVAADLPHEVAMRFAKTVSPPVALGMGVAWATMSLAVIGLLAVVYRRFTVATRALPVAVVNGVTVRVSQRSGPAVIGIVDPEIVVPAWLLDADREQERLVIAHECEHIRARDHLLLIAGCLGVAMLPWHPAAWWVLARLRLTMEMDCDRRVIASGVARSRYGTALIDIAARCQHTPLGVPALADHGTHLERRLLAMGPVSKSYRRTRLVAIGAAALLTIAAACEARLPSSPEIEAMDVSAVEGSPMMKVALGSDTTAAYFVDGVQVPAAETRAIAADDIASISVVKAIQGNEIHITTKAALERTGKAPEPSLLRTVAVPVDSMSQASPSRMKIAIPRGGFAGLILIDGNAATEQMLARLTPDEIETVDVLKGDAARRLYLDPKAANGVIRIMTKR